MEGVLLKVRRPIIVDFYKKKVAEWKRFLFVILRRWNAKKTSFFHEMQLVDAEESVPQKESRVS